MEYKIIITKTVSGVDLTITKKRIDLAIDYFWYFVEDCPKQEINFYKDGVNITLEILKNQTLKNKYYRGLY